MSNTGTKNTELNVTNDDMKEMLAEGAASPEAATAAPKKKNVGYRILALILTVAPIVCLCLLHIKLLIGASQGYAIYGEKTFLDAFLALFKKNGLTEFYAEAAKTVTGATAVETKLFGFLPVLAGAGTVGKAMGLVMYALPLAAVVTVVLMIVALCSGKAAPAMTKAIVFINFWVYAGYALATLAVSMYYNMDKAIDVVILAIAGVSLLFWLVFSFVKNGKGAWMPLLLFVLTVGFAGVCVYGVTECAAALKTLFASTEKSMISSLTKGEFYKYAIVALFAVAGIASVISSIRITTKKGYTFDLIRYIFHLILAVATVCVAFSVDEFKNNKLWAFIAVAIAAVQIVLVILVLCAKKKAKKAAAEVVEEAPVEEAEEETEEEVTEETEEETEEEETGVYAEAVPYDGPTAEVPAREAEELAQPMPDFTTPEEPEPETHPESATADYDFYNSRSFDPFIASLNSKEREQFTEIFILKYRGETKNLPDYEVGGDNSEFFRRVFIYLGQYRDRIPDSLLAKMYQFAVKK